MIYLVPDKAVTISNRIKALILVADNAVDEIWLTKVQQAFCDENIQSLSLECNYELFQLFFKDEDEDQYNINFDDDDE